MLPFVVQEFRSFSLCSTARQSDECPSAPIITYLFSLFTFHLSFFTFHFSLINFRHRFIPEGEKDYRQAVERSETPVR